jgi:hypothetical protein
MERIQSKIKPQNLPTDQAQEDADRIAINGFQQIVEMLRIADPQFRESLLRRIASKDIEMAHSLRRNLKGMDV